MSYKSTRTGQVGDRKYERVRLATFPYTADGTLPTLNAYEGKFFTQACTIYNAHFFTFNRGLDGRDIFGGNVQGLANTKDDCRIFTLHSIPKASTTFKKPVFPTRVP